MAEFDFSQAIGEARSKYESIAKALDIERLKSQIATLETEAAKPGLWDDPENAQKVTSRLSAAQAQLKRLNEANRRIEDVETLVELAQEEADADSLSEAQSEIGSIAQELDDMEIQTLLDGEYSDLKYFYDLALSLEDADACRKYTELTAAGLHYSGAFQTGDTAMMPMGYWYVATLINNIKNGLCDFEWGITALPHKEDVQAGSSFGNLTGIMINKKSEHKDLAWEYVSWLCGPEGAKVTAGCGNRPAWVSEEVAEVLASVDGFPKDENSKAALLPSMVSIEIGVSDKLAEIQTILNEEHTMIMTREISVDEGIEEMNERVAELYE